jgi:hypothetical protein
MLMLVVMVQGGTVWYIVGGAKRKYVYARTSAYMIEYILTRLYLHCDGENVNIHYL